ncbi:MAG: 2-hydroxyacyl-CoA dehydratase family protein [Acetobacteraceae bacterium]|nr:2-hydroxyacyl-CoA dehydratase family protein [Acetobacteraceae bacterium]
MPFEEVRRAFLRHLAPRLLRSGLLYQAADRLARLREADYPFKASALMVRHGLQLTRRAYSRRFRRRTVWTNVFFPTELAYALDLVPFSPEVASASAAALGLDRFLLSTAEGRWYSSDACSFHRCALGGAIAGLTPEPAALAVCGAICDGVPKLFERASEIYRRPFRLVHVPCRPSVQAQEYLAGELEDLYLWLARATGAEPRADRLREALDLSNRARAHMLEVLSYRQSRPCPLNGGVALGYLYPLFLAQGSPGAVEVYGTLARELAQRVREGRGALTQERYRILWLHLKPFYPSRLFTILEEELGAVVVCEEMTQVYWEELDLSRPFFSLAGKVLSHFQQGPAQRRAEAVVEAALRFKVDGAVHFSHWGCRQSTGGVRVVKDALAAVGVPLLDLGGDCVDSSAYSEEQARTRLSAFVEMLEARRG